MDNYKLINHTKNDRREFFKKGGKLFLYGFLSGSIVAFFDAFLPDKVFALNYCPNCGKKLTGDPKYCPNCGKLISGAGKDTSTETGENRVTECSIDYDNRVVTGYLSDTGESCSFLITVYAGCSGGTKTEYLDKYGLHDRTETNYSYEAGMKYLHFYSSDDVVFAVKVNCKNYDRDEAGPWTFKQMEEVQEQKRLFVTIDKWTGLRLGTFVGASGVPVQKVIWEVTVYSQYGAGEWHATWEEKVF